MNPPAVSIPGVELLDELGRGAHSVVYRVRREGRYFAAKLPLYDAGGEHADLLSRRFLREAMALARVRHPALPSVMEVGHAGQTPYIIMDLAAGETLEERLRSGRLEESQAIELACQLADALAQVHDSGLAHRDVKPANILFDPHTTAVRLIDFGLAAPVENSVSSHPPRQRLDDPSLGGIRADLFALGWVLFQCATGASPSADLDPAPLLERHSDGELHPKISRPLAAILRGLIGLEAPGYASAADVLQDLRALASGNGKVGAARPPARPQTQQPPLGRERELDRLRAAWRASLAGRGQVVLVRGGAGAGKTHLVQNFAADLSGGGQRCLWVRPEPDQREPFSATRQLIEAHLDEYDRLPPAGRLQALTNFRTLAGDAASLLRVLSPRLAGLFRDSPLVPRPDGAEQIFGEGLAEFLGKLLNDAAPTTVVVDDLQWLDSGSRSVLGRLTDRAASRCLYVLIARDDPENWPGIERLVRTLDPERVWELTLEALDEDCIGELIRRYLAYGRVDVDLLRHVIGLGDGTPLSVLEILRSLLDGGALVPSWGSWRFQPEIAGRLDLPRGSVALLARRIDGLDQTSIDVLSISAALGVTFDPALVSKVSDVPTHRVSAILLDGRRSMLVERISSSSYRFVHESVREALFRRLRIEQRRSLHERVARALDNELLAALEVRAVDSEPVGPAVAEVLRSFEAAAQPRDNDVYSDLAKLVYQVAFHYTAGEGTNPARARATCVAAGRLAFKSFDSELALRFFDAAAKTGEGSAADLGLEVELLRAECQLRTGALEPGIERLEAIARATEDEVTRAYALSRIAWTEMQIDVERAWNALREAFRALCVRAPSRSIASLLAAIVAWLKHVLVPPTRVADQSERRRLEVVCTLYYQAGRLAHHTGNIGMLVRACLLCLWPAERLGPSATLSNSYLSYSFMLTALGLRRRGRHYLLQATSVAAATRNPVTYAHALQVHVAIAAWSGDTREALAVAARCLDEYGHWRELSEYCLLAYTLQQIEAVRGRNLDGWKWLDRAIAKLSKHEGPPMALEFLELSVRAALTALGREHESELLLSRLSNITTRPPARGAMIVTSYGSRARLFTECAKLDDRFEHLVAEVEAARYDPKRVHLEVVEYYVHVAHARVHDCLYAEGKERARKVPRLLRAAADLRKAARIPLLQAHAVVIDAYCDLFSGRTQRAMRLFARAEAMAQKEGAPWVLYAVHRGRAHMLRDGALAEAARDQARLAEAIAREHGAAYRLRWIREEFALGGRQVVGHSESGSGSPASAYSPSGTEPQGPRPRRRGYLKSLVRLGQQTARELDPAQQGRQVLDELIDAMRAERGLLFLAREWVLVDAAPESASEANRFPSVNGTSDTAQPDNGEALVLLAARHAAGLELENVRDYDARLLEDISIVEAPDSVEDGPAPNRGIAASHGDRAVVVTPLVVRGHRVGVVYLDRPLRTGVFSQSDARALSALADQVPLVFELGRSLRAREHAKETQRGAEKLEAVGRLAGGIAHDFNNMLSVILTASSQILSQSEGSRRLTEDVETIQSAAERARDLTRQLLAFSRGQYLNPEVLKLNETVSRLAPIFRRLLGERVTLDLTLDANLCLVKADPAQIDQVLTNLIVNAGDAMPRGGRIRIATRNVTVGKPEATEQLPRGRYAQIIVSDTGEGMDEATRARAFEPFFTTKAARSGSGLGLATAYGIIRQSGGHVELESKLGSGTTFRIYLPDTGPKTPTASVPPPDPAPRGNETILLVDDEPLVRASTHRILRALGYTVLAAGNSDEALSIARQRISGIDLVVTDVIMPGMNGLELARELSRLRPSVKVLFMSGYTDGVLAERGVLRDSVAFVQKPVTREKLAQRMRSLLDARRR